MNKLFDLRFVIGLFFLVIGVLLFVYGIAFAKTTINVVCGTVFAVFGTGMLLLSQRDPEDRN